MLAEDALHGDELRPVLVEPLLDALLHGDEAVPEVGVGRGAHDADTDHGERSARDALDDPDTAAGQPWVHPQYAHCPSHRSPVCAGYRVALTKRRADGVCPVGPLSQCARYASTFSMTSSLTSKLAKTFCTSSLSSRASISLKIFRAPSSSSSTCMVGTKLASADS